MYKKESKVFFRTIRMPIERNKCERESETREKRIYVNEYVNKRERRERKNNCWQANEVCVSVRAYEYVNKCANFHILLATYLIEQYPPYTFHTHFMRMYRFLWYVRCACVWMNVCDFCVFFIDIVQIVQLIVAWAERARYTEVFITRRE